MAQRGSTPLCICLSDPQERDEAVAKEAAQNSVKKGAIWAIVHLSSTRLILLARCGVLKRHDVGEGEGELRADNVFNTQ